MTTALTVRNKNPLTQPGYYSYVQPQKHFSLKEISSSNAIQKIEDNFIQINFPNSDGEEQSNEIEAEKTNTDLPLTSDYGNGSADYRWMLSIRGSLRRLQYA